MTQPYQNEHGQIVVRDAAGGHGGGATSSVVRPATDEEVLAFHSAAVAYAEANVVAAEQALDAAKKAHPAFVAPPPAVPPAAVSQAERDRLAQVERERVAQAERNRVASQVPPAAPGGAPVNVPNPNFRG